VSILTVKCESFKVKLRLMLEVGNDDYRAFAAPVRHAAGRDRMTGWRRALGLG